MKLSEKMKSVLLGADLEKNEIYDVPLKTAWALEDRGLIPSNWTHSTSSTGGGMFPLYGGIKLTELGKGTALLIKKRKKVS